MPTRIEYPGGTICSICGRSATTIMLGGASGVRVEHGDTTCTARRLPLLPLHMWDKWKRSRATATVVEE